MSARKPPPTFEEVNRRFAYDPKTGIVTCKIRCGSVRKHGDTPGTTMRDGYRCIRIVKARYPETHIIWLLMTGEWPAQTVDHRDLDKNNNRWVNLRAASFAQQQANRPLQRNNSSGHRGVSKTKNGTWRAAIKVGSKSRHLGTFADLSDAIDAYNAAARDVWGDYYDPAKSRTPLAQPYRNRRKKLTAPPPTAKEG